MEFSWRTRFGRVSHNLGWGTIISCKCSESAPAAAQCPTQTAQPPIAPSSPPSASKPSAATSA